MTRRTWTRRQLVEAWEESGGRCWRCGQKIIHGVYGRDWEMGHTDKAHWLGGNEYAPEHVLCNREDGKLQAKLSAKSIRIRARNIGVKKTTTPKRKYEGKVKYDWKRQRYVKVSD